jgi:hypothetical protein
MQAEFAEKEKQLETLRQKTSAVHEELAQYYELLMQEFWNEYPRLSYCEEVALPLERMGLWLEDRRAKAGRQE